MAQFIYLPAQPTTELQSFAAPILHLGNSTVAAPWFGANRWECDVDPVAGGGLGATYLQLRLRFNDGGAFDFDSSFRRLRERLSEATAAARERRQMPGSERGAPGVDLDSVHLDDLPAYEAPGSDYAVLARAAADAPAAALTTQLVGDDSSAVESSPQTAQSSPIDARLPTPTEPPPRYEDVQRESIEHEVERQLRDRGGDA